LSISDGNQIDLAPIIPPGGTDDQQLTLNGTTLSIEDGNTVVLSSLQDGVNDADSDPTNEIETWSTLQGIPADIADGDDTADADADPSNEIQALSLNGATLNLSNGGGNVDLSGIGAVSYTHLRAHETVLDLVCRLLLEKKKKRKRHDN